MRWKLFLCGTCLIWATPGLQSKRMVFLAAFFALALNAFVQADEAQSKPNIVYVMCDDLGYGDVQSLNPENGKIATPAVDRLAREGMIFTDAHSGSSVCTPTRYGLLTGRYCWRSKHQRGVVQGFAPCLIAEDRQTVAGFLKDNGYHTAMVGKWHLNFQYTDPESGEVLKRNGGKGKLAPVGSKIPDGPLAHGFDYFHGFHHAGDMRGVIDGDEVIKHEDEINMLPRITRKSVEYIDSRGRADNGQPFFLYVPYGSPHSPILPTPEWQGKSGLGDYADFVMETDAGFGEILDALERNGFTENTLVVFTSDNGCSRIVNIPKLREKGHHVSGQFRGSKADLWDGGHRVPFVVRWPGKIEPGSASEQLICHTDLFATCVEILGLEIPETVAEDSVSILPAFSNQKIVSTRGGIIHHSVSGHFSYRLGKWKLLLARGSGGWTAPNEKKAKSEGAPIGQLYDMQNDPSETTNLFETNPQVVQQLLDQLTLDVGRGRSTDGPKAANDIEKIKLWKSGQN